MFSRPFLFALNLTAAMACLAAVEAGNSPPAKPSTEQDKNFPVGNVPAGSKPFNPGERNGKPTNGADYCKEHTC